MLKLEDILLQKQSISSLSADASFTLDDILQEPTYVEEEEVINYKVFQYQGMFPDDEDEEKQKQPQPIVRQEKVEERISVKSTKDVKPLSRHTRLKDMPIPSVSEIQNMNFAVLKNVTSLFEGNQNRGVGIPTAISATGSKFLAIGTSLGNVALFEVGVRNYKILGTADQRKFGQVTSIAISADNKYLVAGHETGLITVWDLYYYSLLKQELTNRCKILKVLFISSNSQNFLVNDIEGNISLYTIQKYIWVNLSHQKLFEKTEDIYLDIKTLNLRSNRQIMALSTLNDVLIISVKPQFKLMHRLQRPQGVYLSKIPNIELGRCEYTSFHNIGSIAKRNADVLCVSWANSIYIYRFYESNLTHESISLVGIVEIEETIYHMEFISESVLVVLDNRQVFRTYRMTFHHTTFQFSSYLINQRELPQQLVYQRYLKDKNNKYIKSFNNMVINCSLSLKQKDLFLICKNSIFRCRLHRWHEYISQLMNEKRDFMRAVKVAIHVSRDELDIFVEKVESSTQNKKIYCDIGKIYLQERLEQIKKFNSERIRNYDEIMSISLVEQQLQETFDTLIEYFLEVKQIEYLFTKIYSQWFISKALPDDYENKFLDCLQIFITHGLIKLIPSVQVFRIMTDYYLRKGRKEVVDKLIMSLDPNHLFYEDTIEICSSNRIYRSLSYVCSTHGDFISPATKILFAVKQFRNQQKSTAQKASYDILMDYLFSILKGFHINQTKIEAQSINRMLKGLSTWITCEQNLEFFTKSAKQYMLDYFEVLLELLTSLSQHQGLRDIHNIISQLQKQSHSFRSELCLLLVKISRKVDLKDKEVNIILSSSSLEQIEDNLSWYFTFTHHYHQKLVEQSEQQMSSLFQSKHIHYLFQVLAKKTINQQMINFQQNQSNSLLCNFILQNVGRASISLILRDLLRFNSKNTMIFMLQNYSIEEVNQRLFSIENHQQRYLIIRKLLKKIRQQNAKGIMVALPSKKTNSKKNNSMSNSMKSSVLSSSSATESCSEADPKQVRKYVRLSKEIMQFYLECLCMYKKRKRIYYELEEYFQDYAYNIDRLLLIVSPFNLGCCQGLFLAHQKISKEAYEFFQKEYQFYFYEQNFAKLMRVEHCHGRFMRKMFNKMLECVLQVGEEEYWIRLINDVIAPLQQNTGMGVVVNNIQNVFTKKADHPFLKQLLEILEECLSLVSRKVPMEVISRFIGQHSDLFNKTFVLTSFGTTLSNYSKNAYIFVLSNQMIINDQIIQFHKIENHKIKGWSSPSTCFKCCQPFKMEDRVRVYSCQHAYHTTCCREEHSQTCEKCRLLEIGGEVKREAQDEPDFSKPAQSNMIISGVSSMISFIPDMIMSIPTRKLSQNEIQLEEKKQTNIDDEAYNCLAFREVLEHQEDDFHNFVEEYKKYLDII